MSLMVKPSRGGEKPVLVNFESKEKNYKGNRFMCPSDGWARCLHASHPPKKYTQNNQLTTQMDTYNRDPTRV